MTPEEYLQERGWLLRAGSPTALTPIHRLDFWIDPLAGDALMFRDDAVAIQVQRDRDCAEFVAAYQTGETDR